MGLLCAFTVFDSARAGEGNAECRKPNAESRCASGRSPKFEKTEKNRRRSSDVRELHGHEGPEIEHVTRSGWKRISRRGVIRRFVSGERGEGQSIGLIPLLRSLRFLLFTS